MDEKKLKELVGSGIQIVTFRLGAESYGVPVGKVKEIIRPIKAFPVPGMVSPVEGVINLRGEIVPVLGIHTILGVQKGDDAEECRKRRIIILDSEGGGFGFVVDEVMEVIRISSRDVQTAPDFGTSGSCEEAIIGMVQISGRMVICIDLKKLVKDFVNLNEVAAGCT